MNTTDTKSEFLLLFRGSDWDRNLSPAELQKTMSGFVAWFERLNAAGTLKAGQPLLDEARIVSGGNGLVADGPFAESKEAVGGYFLIEAASMDEAVAIAQECPTLRCEGFAIEVRPVAEECPTLQRMREATESSLAAVSLT